MVNSLCEVPALEEAIWPVFDGVGGGALRGGQVGDDDFSEMRWACRSCLRRGGCAGGRAGWYMAER
jgi:hypothetical protein